MARTVYDVTKAVVEEDEVVLALIDTRDNSNSVMIIRPYIASDGSARWTAEEPDGTDRLYWLEKFGIITSAEFQAESATYADVTEKRALYQRLQEELDEPDAKTLRQRVAALEEDRDQAGLERQAENEQMERDARADERVKVLDEVRKSGGSV